jgi:hypothetical protein
LVLFQPCYVPTILDIRWNACEVSSAHRYPTLLYIAWLVNNALPVFLLYIPVLVQLQIVGEPCWSAHGLLCPHCTFLPLVVEKDAVAIVYV